MGYLDELRSFVSQNEPDGAPTKPTKGGSVGSVGSSGARFHNPTRDLKGWQSALSGLDPCEPRGMPMGRWQMLYDAAAWFLDAFGDQAARDGWSTGDLFGLRHGFPGTGGLIERLGDNRGLVMADGRACWRSRGVPMQFNRGGGDGLPAFWELGG